MALNIFYVEKTSGTSSDTLLTIGFAILLQDILQQCKKVSKGIFIQNANLMYQVHLPVPITDSDILSLKKTPRLVRPLSAEKQNAKQLKAGWNIETFGFPYDSQRLKSKMYYEGRKTLQGFLKSPEAIWQKEKSAEFERVEQLRPMSELRYYLAISQMKVVDTFNEITRRWYTLNLEQIQLLLGVLLTLFGSEQNNLDDAVAKWQTIVKSQRISGGAEVTALQVINPTTGKGANRTKAGGVPLSNLSTFWPLELLKFTGFTHAAAPYVVKDSKDRKTYVLQPNKIELNKLEALMDDFRKVCWSSTAVKLDIMASLRFAQTFIEHRKQFFANEEEEEDPFEEKQLSNLIQGFEVAQYKDLGSAYATMNISTIHSPTWLTDINGLEDAETASQLVKEHIRIIQGIQDVKGKEGSEEYTLLRFYRDFLSGHDVRPFLQFAATYGSYLMHQWEHEKNPKRHIQQLSYKGVETILMGTKQENISLTEITGNASFKRIASAIRQSTVILQYKKARGEDPIYDIRYGLGQDLMRKAHHRDEFMKALSDFLLLYSTENARVAERSAKSSDKKSLKRRVQVEIIDIHNLEMLFDKFHSAELVCKLLVACGSLSDFSKSKKQEASDELIEEPDESSLDNEEE